MTKEEIIKEWKHLTASHPEDKIIIKDGPSDFYNQPAIVRSRERALEVIRKCGIPKFD
jgi:hypothetical protein